MFTTDKTKVLWISGILIISFFFSGCAGPYVPKSDVPTIEDVEEVVLLDKDLRKKVAVDHKSLYKTEDGRIEAKATLRNMKKYRLHVQVQTVFKGTDGFSLAEDSAWQDIILSSYETKTYSCKSLSGKAESFTIRIRLPR
jgi:uncharacterized protein YcfL